MAMSGLIPKAEYSNQKTGEVQVFEIDPTASHSTIGKTTGSTVTDVADFIDKDKPSLPQDTELGKLRAMVTTLQDDMNVFLTLKLAKTEILNEEDEVVEEEEEEEDDEEES